MIAQKQRIQTRVLLYAGIFVMFFVFNSCLVFRADDLRYMSAPEDYGSLWNWFVYYYLNWSGRALHLLYVPLTRMPVWIFRTLNALVLTGLAWCLERLAACFILPANEKPALPALTVAAGALTVCTSSLFNTVLWGCASLSFVWGLAACLFTVWVICRAFCGEAVSPFLWIAAALCACFAAYAEQPAATLLGCLLALLAAFLLSRRRIPFPFWAVLGLTAVNCAVNLAAPGNGVRSFAETISRWPDYGSYNLWQKLALGLTYGLDALTGPLARYVFILAGLLTLRLLLCRRWLSALMGILCTGYWMLASARDFVPAVEPLFAFVSGDNLYGGGNHALLLTWLGLFFWFLLCGLLLADGGQPDWAAGLMGLAVLANLVVMGFSPSLYASLERPFYVSNILINLLSLRQLFRGAVESHLPRWAFWLPSAVLAAYGLLTMYRAFIMPVA